MNLVQLGKGTGVRVSISQHRYFVSARTCKAWLLTILILDLKARGDCQDTGNS